MFYTPHERALTVLFGDIDNVARQQPDVLVGTPGSVVERKNATGTRFFVHKFYDGEGKQRETYLGAVGSSEGETAAEAMRNRIAETKDIIPSVRLLGREGFNLATPRTFATVATLANHDVFEAGGFLIGSHAYGVLLNHLGVRAAPYETEDIDIARPHRLAFRELPKVGFLEMLQASGIAFVAVPGLGRKQPSSSFERRGRSRFHVDLLVPADGDDYATVAVPELQAHATALPYLAYLLADSQGGTMISRVGCCRVRLPLPERFATHKLIVSQLRTGPSIKSSKDVHQALVLGAALAREHPGALADAAAAVPKSARKHVRAALAVAEAARTDLPPRAVEEWTDGLAGGKA